MDKKKNSKKSETEDSTDDVFYSMSSAVSVSGTEISTRTPSPIPTSQETTPSSSGTKSKGLSKLKGFKPRKLIPKRFKSSSVGDSSSENTEILATLLDADPNTKNLSGSDVTPPKSGKKESKIPKKSKTSQIVRRFTFNKKKVGPKEGGETDTSTSSSTTPNSGKRELPDGVLSISETSLLPVEERSVEESSVENSERRNSSSASSSGQSKQELKITISGKKIEKLKQFYENNSNTSINTNNNNNKLKTKDDTSFETLKYSVSASNTNNIIKRNNTNKASLLLLSSSTDKTSLNASASLNDKQLLPSPPPTPLMSYYIPLKSNTPPMSTKPISTISTTKRDQVPSSIPMKNKLESNEKLQITTDSDEQSSSQQQKKYPGETKAILEKLASNKKEKESLKAKFINKLNINRSVHDITPTVLAPIVPYEITDTEIKSILKPNTSIESEPTSTSFELSPDEYKEFIKKDREDSLSELTSEKIFTLSEDTTESMQKRSEGDTKGGEEKRTKKQVQGESTNSDSGVSTSVHVQEPQTPYQKQLSVSKSNDNLEQSGEVTINKTGEISFRIGTPVRPPTNITHITESISIDSGDNNKQSLEEISSISSESQSPPLSENSRRKIKYLPQPTLPSSEDQALIEGNFGPPSSYISDYSIDYSLNPFSMVDNNTTEGAGTQQGPTATNPTMSSSEKREHLYKILVIGELGTGKTSFIKRYVHQFFSQNYRATIGVDFALKVLNWDPNTIIRLQLWDIAGQERFGNMTRVYYKEAVGAFIVFDVTRTSTFDAVIKWKQDLDSKVQLPDGSSIPCILLANKCDQQKQGIVTTPAKLDEYCKENGFSGWFETSAKENINIDDAAKALVNKILANDKVMNSNEAENDGFAIDGRDNGTSKKNCAC